MQTGIGELPDSGWVGGVIPPHQFIFTLMLLALIYAICRGGEKYEYGSSNPFIKYPDTQRSRRLNIYKVFLYSFSKVMLHLL